MSSIYVTLGKWRYVGGTGNEISGKDISAATFTIGLGSDNITPPAVFTAPDVNVTGTSAASRTLKLLVSSTIGSGASVITLPGTHYVWGNIVDAPEIEPMALHGPIVVV